MKHLPLILILALLVVLLLAAAAYGAASWTHPVAAASWTGMVG